MGRAAGRPARGEVIGMQALLLVSPLTLVAGWLSGRPLPLAGALALFGAACLWHARLRGARASALMAAGLLVSAVGIVMEPWWPAAGLASATLGFVALAAGVLGVLWANWRDRRGAAS